MDQEITGSCDVYPTALAVLSGKLLWINVLVIALSLLDAALLFKAAMRSVLLMRRLRAWAADQAQRLAAAAAAGVRRAQMDGPPSAGRRTSAGVGDSPARPAEAGAHPPEITFSFEGTLDDNSSGDIFVKAHVAGASPGSRGIVFVPGDDDTAPAEFDDDGGAGRDFIVGGGGDAAAAAEAAQKHDARRLELAAAAAKALQTAWATMPWRDRLRFVNGWAILALAADVCNVASASLCLQGRLGSIPTEVSHALLMGFGLVFLWVGALRFMEHDRCVRGGCLATGPRGGAPSAHVASACRTYFNIILTLRRATPRVLRFLAGVLPVFLAYVLFAVVVFSDRVPRFVDFGTAAVTLFANLNGDVLRECVARASGAWMCACVTPCASCRPLPADP